MKKDALDRLIAKNEKQNKIRSEESIFAVKSTVLGFIFYLTLIPAAYWIAQDHVRFFNDDLWGISKIFWLVGLHILALIAVQLFFDGFGLLAVLRWVQFDQDSRWWMKTLWSMFQLLKLFFIMTIVVALIYGAYAFTQLIRNHGDSISTYFSDWHFIPHNIFYLAMMLLLMWLFLIFILISFHNIKNVSKLWFDQQYFVQQMLPQAKNDDWI